MAIPRISHTIRRSHVLQGRLAIRPSEIRIPRIGVSGNRFHTRGAVNGRGRSGRFTRSTHTPADTITKASSVPMDVSWPRTLIGSTPAKIATKNPTTIEEIHGVRKRG